jgi:K+ transporter
MSKLALMASGVVFRDIGTRPLLEGRGHHPGDPVHSAVEGLGVDTARLTQAVLAADWSGPLSPSIYFGQVVWLIRPPRRHAHPF